MPGVWAIEDKFDASMISPDWHGWMHYMHDRPGSSISEEFSPPFKQQHRVNQTFLRPCFGIDGNDQDLTHKPPGQWGNRVERGRLGPKYQAWDPSGDKPPALTRNHTDSAGIRSFAE